jgi:hypothetical protein
VNAPAPSAPDTGVRLAQLMAALSMARDLARQVVPCLEGMLAPP